MKITWKHILWTIVFLGVAFALVHLVWILLYSKSIVYTTETILLAEHQEELNGYQIAFITDIHDATGEELQSVVEQLNQKEIDVLIFGGDLGWGNLVWEQFQTLSKVETTHGMLAVGGNHDRVDNLEKACDKYGITLLSNKGVSLGNGLYIGGIEDLWTGVSDVSTAVEHAQIDEFVLLVSHNPDIAMEQSMKYVDYVISGHTHGGHVTMFGVWAPALSIVTKFGYTFHKGLSKGIDGTPVYTSRGTGWYNKVPRVFSRPEVVIFQFQTI